MNDQATAIEKELRTLTTFTGAWAPLFNGKDTDGWHSSAKSGTKWQVNDGVLTGSEGRGLLVTDRDDYENFRIKVEAKFDAGGDSGLFFRIPDKDSTLDDARGYEIQIAHRAETKTGTIYLCDVNNVTLAPSKLDIAPGKWFTLEVLAEGNHITVWVDGQKVAEHEHRDGSNYRGAIGLQNVSQSGASVHFKRVEIQELLSK